MKCFERFVCWKTVQGNEYQELQGWLSKSTKHFRIREISNSIKTNFLTHEKFYEIYHPACIMSFTKLSTISKQELLYKF